MIPRASKTGRSFNGIVAYMAHDPDKAKSSDRLGFVDFHNIDVIASDDHVRDMERAGAIMAWTAMHQVDLAELHHTQTMPALPFKRAKAPMEKPVYSFSLRLRPEDAAHATDDLLRKAARGALETLGMSACQTIIVQHTDFTHSLTRADLAAPAGEARHVPDDLMRIAYDQNAERLALSSTVIDDAARRQALIVALSPTKEAPDPATQIDVRLLTKTPYTATPSFPRHGAHVHVIVNLVDPNTGLAVRTSYDFLKLSRFAEAFSRDHGLTQIVTRVDNNAKRARGQNVRYQEIPRSQWALLKTYRGKTQTTVERERRAQQDADTEQLDGRHRAATDKLDREIIKPWTVDRDRLRAERALIQHRLRPQGLFAIAVQIARRLTGHTRADAKTLRNIDRSIANIDGRLDDYRRALTAAQTTERERLARRHAAERARDTLYFEVLRKRADDEDRQRQMNLIAAQQRARRDQGKATLPNLIKELGGDPVDSNRQTLGSSRRDDDTPTMRRLKDALDRVAPRNPDRPKRPRKPRKDHDPNNPDRSGPRRKR